MRSKETVEFTNMCMVYDGDKVLVQDRVKGSWTGIAFPGGHVEQGEPFTDAVIREVYEETGLQIASPQLCGIKDRINFRENCILPKKARCFGQTERSFRRCLWHGIWMVC